MTSTSILRTALGCLAACACLVGCAAPAETSSDDTSEGDPGTTGTTEQALMTGLPGGCALEAMRPSQHGGLNTGAAYLRCLSFTKNRHEVSVVIEQCNFGSCVTLPMSVHLTRVAANWSGAWLYASRSIAYAPNTIYRTRACATVFAPSGALLGSACTISAAANAS